MFDVVVVGAGSAGCVLAHRLSADPKRKVALLEAGGAQHRSFKVRAPGAWPDLWRTKLDWGLSTVPQQHANNRRIYQPRGKLLGGSSCLNALIYIRGHRDNYDEWRDLGNAGWGWSDVLPYFKKSEDNTRGASEYHGTGGPLSVGDHPSPAPVCRAFAEALAKQCNTRVTDDFNGAEQEGAGIFQHTVKSGARCSTAVGFLDSVRDRANLTVITGAHALGLVLDGDRATGVRCRIGGSEQVIEGREIVLAAGAIGSPQLLLLSGIGPADELRVTGIEPRHDLRGVGKHLEDHLMALVYFEANANATRKLTAANMGWAALTYALGGKGILAEAPTHAGAFVKSRPEEPRPDIQFHMSPWGWLMPNSDEPRPRMWGRYAGFAPGLIYPKSQGEIRLASADPTAAPLIDPRYFSNPADLEHLVNGIKLTREMTARSPLREMLGAEIFPGPSVSTDEQIREHVRATCQTIFHPTGTCKMGNDKSAVVDSELRVHGIRGLRVADASIMPRIVGGNTNAPVIMIAEKAADLIQSSSV
jgi:choline dehydrogenase-like flavoprotein